MKRFVLACIVLAAFPILSFSQEVVVTTGGTVSGSGSISYTVGQVFYISSEDSSGSTLQGVQQSIELFALSTADEELIQSVKTFPNPTKDVFVLKFQNMEWNEFTFILMDINGKTLQSGTIKSNQSFINIQGYSKGIYLLRLFNKKNPLKTFKILKN